MQIILLFFFSSLAFLFLSFKVAHSAILSITTSVIATSHGAILCHLLNWPFCYNAVPWCCLSLPPCFTSYPSIQFFAHKGKRIYFWPGWGRLFLIGSQASVSSRRQGWKSEHFIAHMASGLLFLLFYCFQNIFWGSDDQVEPSIALYMTTISSWDVNETKRWWHLS